MKSYAILLVLLLSSSLSWAKYNLSSLPELTSLNEIKVSKTNPKTTVVVFLSATCPCSGSHETLLKEWAQQFPEFQFVGIHSNADEAFKLSQEHFTKSQLGFPVLQDQKSKWANIFGALKTPHTFVISKDGDLLYAGGVTDSHVGPQAKKLYLKEVLSDLQSGKPPRHKEGRALGCYIQREEGA